MGYLTNFHTESHFLIEEPHCPLFGSDQVEVCSNPYSFLSIILLLLLFMKSRTVFVGSLVACYLGDYSCMLLVNRTRLLMDKNILHGFRELQKDLFFMLNLGFNKNLRLCKCAEITQFEEIVKTDSW